MNLNKNNERCFWHENLFSIQMSPKSRARRFKTGRFLFDAVPRGQFLFFNIACVCALIQRDVWRTTSWWFRFKPPWAVTVNSSSERIMPNMNSSGTPWWVSCIPKVTFLWLPRFNTHPPQSHVDTAAHTHTKSERGGEKLGFKRFFIFWCFWNAATNLLLAASTSVFNRFSQKLEDCCVFGVFKSPFSHFSVQESSISIRQRVTAGVLSPHYMTGKWQC